MSVYGSRDVVFGTPSAAKKPQRHDPVLEPVVEAALGVLVWVLAHPVLSATAGLGAYLGVTIHPAAPVVAAVTVTILLVVWQIAHPRSFWVLTMPWRHELRRWSRYERRWEAAMVLCDLGDRFGAASVLPRLRRFKVGRHRDRLNVRMLKGQTPDDYDRAAEALAHSFGAPTCRVRADRPGRVWLEFAHTDALARPISALPVPASVGEVDLAAVPVGRTDTGDPWRLRLLGSHLLVAGATGAGKGSVLWSIVRGLAPAIRDGLVEAWAVDPKGGMELGLGRALFTRFADDDPAQTAELLEDAVAAMRSRTARLRGHVRLHTPAVGDPLLLVVVDELAGVSAYLSDRELKRRIGAALSLLLSQGGAVGVSVVAALQDPRKDVLPFRDLFPARVALRLTEPEQVAMVLGDGARDRGALCDRIDEGQPGVGYVVLDGVREPVRVRSAHVRDDDVRAMAAAYPAWPGPAPSNKPGNAEAGGTGVGMTKVGDGPDPVETAGGRND